MSGLPLAEGEARLGYAFLEALQEGRREALTPELAQAVLEAARD